MKNRIRRLWIALRLALHRNTVNPAPSPDDMRKPKKMRSLTAGSRPIQIELGFAIHPGPTGIVYQLGRDGKQRLVRDETVKKLVYEEYYVLYELARQAHFRGGPPSAN